MLHDSFGVRRRRTRAGAGTGGKLTVTVATRAPPWFPPRPSRSSASTAHEDAAVPPAKTRQGGRDVRRPRPGRYTIGAEFPGFEPGSLRDVRVRTGDNKQSSSCRSRT